MKKQLSLLVYFLLPTVICAQSHYKFFYDRTQKKIIKYDVTDSKGTVITAKLGSNDDLSKIRIHSGDFISVIIENINTYVYAINIDIQNQFFNQTPPKLLTPLFTDFDPSAFAQPPGVPANVAHIAAPSYPQSTKLADDIKRVITARKDFFIRSLALTYRNFESGTPPAINGVRTITSAQLLQDYNNAINYMGQVESDYLLLRKAAQADDKTLMDDIYKGYTAKDYPTAFDNYLKEQLNISSSDFTFTTPEVISKGEKVHIAIAITPVANTDDQKTIATNSATSGDYFLNVRKLWHWSFSTGFFTSTLGSKTYVSRPMTQNNKATVSPVDTVTGYQNVLDNNTKVSVGANALIHYTYKVTPGFEIGGHFGLGVPINTTFKMNYLIGGSLLFFNDNRLGINFGLAAGYVQELSPNVATNVVYKNLTDVPITYVDKFKADRIQFSITYSLSDLFKGSTDRATSGAGGAAKN